MSVQSVLSYFSSHVTRFLLECLTLVRNCRDSDRQSQIEPIQVVYHAQSSSVLEIQSRDRRNMREATVIESAKRIHKI